MTEPAPSRIVGRDRRREMGDAAELHLPSLSSPNTSNAPDLQVIVSLIPRRDVGNGSPFPQRSPPSWPPYP